MITVRHPSKGPRAGRNCQRNSVTPLGPGPQARRTLATFLLWKVARPQAEHPLKNETDVSPCGASFFLSDQKETKESPGVGIFKKDLRLTPWSFRNPTPRTPVFTGGARGVRGQSRPARKSLEQCQKIITAVLLNELDRLLLQDAIRLSALAYTVGDGPAATWGRPYGIARSLTSRQVG